MRFGVGVLLLGVLALAACGGSNDSSADEPMVEVASDDENGVVRQAADDATVINGCAIEPNTQCPGADLSGANVSYANLSSANLRGADLSYAELSDVDLSDADLVDAILTGTDLSYSDLSYANLTGADMSGVDVSMTRFCNTTMPDGSVRNDDC